MRHCSMAKTEQELIERDLKRDIWQEILEEVQNIKAGNIEKTGSKAASNSVEQEAGDTKSQKSH